MFGRRKQSVIDRRLRELRREMEQVRTELRSAGRSAPAGAPPGPAPAAPPGDPLQDLDLFGRAPGRPAPPAAGAASRVDPVDSEPHAVRRKFASYFMAGHFQNLRPTRHDSRVLRNKAIVMIALVLLLLVCFIYHVKAS